MREFAAERGIVYQGFSLLTANARELTQPAIARAARRTGRSPAEVVFRFALAVGMLPLTGSFVPFAVTKAAREAARDPRPSIEERYQGRAQYQDPCGFLRDHVAGAREDQSRAHHCSQQQGSCRCVQ